MYLFDVCNRVVYIKDFFFFFSVGIHLIKRTNSVPSEITNQITNRCHNIRAHHSHGNLVNMHQIKDQSLNTSTQSDSYSTASSTSSVSSSPFHSDSPRTPGDMSSDVNLSVYQSRDEKFCFPGIYTLLTHIFCNNSSNTLCGNRIALYGKKISTKFIYIYYAYINKNHGRMFFNFSMLFIKKKKKKRKESQFVPGVDTHTYCNNSIEHIVYVKNFKQYFKFCLCV